MVVKDGWQTAHIIYDNQSSLETFHTTQWSVIHKKDSLSTTPSENYTEYNTVRNQNTLKISNLLRGTTAFDISEYIADIKGKTCFILRTRGKYERTCYGFVSFENKDME